MNKNLAFTGSYTQKPFWYQQFNVWQIIILRGVQRIVGFDAAHNSRLYVTTIKSMNFQDDMPSNSNFKNHRVLVFDLTSIEVATENCHYPELV